MSPASSAFGNITYARQKGPFVRHCPCMPGAVSCGYFNLDLHTGCPYDCSYCILQAYLPSKHPVFFTNIIALKREVRSWSENRRHLRLGTGELSDSLAWDRQTGYAGKMLALLERFPEIVFEFKTKSAAVSGLLAYPRVPLNMVVSWSLNPEPVIEREERGTPSLARRLVSLAKIQERGYRIGIHFDPLILFPQWRARYRTLIRSLGRLLRPDRIAWWSLGALRFPPSLRDAIFSHRDSRLFWGELVPTADGKYRYFRPLRLELFGFIVSEIRRHVSADAPLYLCMEPEEIWREVLPDMPTNEKDLNRQLYERVMDKN